MIALGTSDGWCHFGEFENGKPLFKVQADRSKCSIMHLEFTEKFGVHCLEMVSLAGEKQLVQHT
jgi:hypothetical protein